MTNNRENIVKTTLKISLFSIAFVLLSNFLDIPFYYLVFTIVFFSIALIKIEYGVYLMAFFLPVINWNFYLGNFEIPFIDFLAGAVFIAYFLQNFLVREFRHIKFPHLLSFSLFFIATILSSIFSDNIFSNLWYSIRWILFFYLVYIALPFNIIKNERILKNSFIFFSLSVLAVSLMGLFSIFSQDWLNTIARAKPMNIFGIFIIGENQNLMAETLLPGVFILLALKYWVKELFLKRLINILIFFVAFILLLTFSRGAWLSLLLVSSFLAIVYYRKNIHKFLIPLSLILLVMIPMIYYMVNLQGTFSVGGGSNRSRILLSEIAWDAFRENPILGKGTGEYFDTVAHNIRFRANYGEPVDSHGVLQKILLENGGLGMTTFLLFIFAIFSKFFEVFKSRKFIELYLPVVGAATSVFIFELFNTSYYKGKLWFVLALALITINLIQEKKIYEK